MIGLSLGIGLTGRAGVSIPGLTRPTFAGETPLFLYHPHTETGVTLSGSEVTAVTGISSPNVTRGTTGPLEMTDALGRKFWRFRGPDYLTIAPADITIVPRGITIVAVVRQHANNSGLQYFGQSYNTDGTTPDGSFTPVFRSLAASGALTYIATGSTSSNATATGRTHMAVGSQLQVIGAGNRTTANGGTRFIMNSIAVNGAQCSISSTDKKGARISGYLAGQGTTNRFDLYAMAAFAGELSDARIDAIAAALVASYQIPAITRQVIFEGGSIMYGTTVAGSTDRLNPAMDATHPGAELFPAGTRVINQAISGSTVASMTTRRDAANGYPGAILPGGPANNIVAFMIGHNDMPGIPGATTATNISTYIGQATTGVLAVGFNAYVGTNTGAINGSLQTEIVALRAALRDPAFLTGLDAQAGGANEGRVGIVSLDLIESGGSQRFNTSVHAANTTYYNADGTHMTTLGETLLTTGGDTPAYGWGAVL